MDKITRLMSYSLWIAVGLMLLTESPLPAEVGCGGIPASVQGRSTYGTDCKGCHAKKRKKKSSRLSTADTEESSGTTAEGGQDMTENRSGKASTAA